MFSRLLIIATLLLTFAPAAQAGRVARTSYCQTVEPADWSTTSGRWVIVNETDSPIVLKYTGQGGSLMVALPGPVTGIEKHLRAHVRTGRLRDGSYQRTWMSYLPSGSSCYGVFDVEQFVRASKNGSKITIRAVQLHRANAYELLEHQYHVEDPSELHLTASTYDMDFGPLPGTNRYRRKVTASRLSRSQQHQ